MTKQEWLDKRRSGIGGSDVAAVLGLNPYRTPLDVYSSKVNPVKEETSESAHFGILLEDLVSKEFQRRTGMKAQKVNHMFRDPEHDWMIANIDRALVNPEIQKNVRPILKPEEITKANGRLMTTDIALECKTCSAYKSGLWSPSQEEDIKAGNLYEEHEIPLYYETQIQWYCGILRLRGMFLAVLIGGQEYRMYWIKANPEVFEAIKNKCSEFWHEHVLKKVPPEAQTQDDALKLFPESNGKTVEANTELVTAYGEFARLNAEIKELEKRKDEYKTQLITGLKDNEILTIAGEKVLTYKTQSSRRLDMNKLKKEDPEMYRDLQDDYYKTTKTRVMRLCA